MSYDILLDAIAKLKAKHPEIDDYIYSIYSQCIIVYAVDEVRNVIDSVTYLR